MAHSWIQFPRDRIQYFKITYQVNYVEPRKSVQINLIRLSWRNSIFWWMHTIDFCRQISSEHLTWWVLFDYIKHDSFHILVVIENNIWTYLLQQVRSTWLGLSSHCFLTCERLAFRTWLGLRWLFATDEFNWEWNSSPAISEFQVDLVIKWSAIRVFWMKSDGQSVIHISHQIKRDIE